MFLPAMPSTFLSKIAFAEIGCWEWLASLGSNGYGQYRLRVGGKLKTVRPHRLTYEMAYGPVPDGLELDHLCRVRHCVRPDHLEPVTRSENNRRGLLSAGRVRPTHCKWGHPFDAENTLVTADGNWACRACRRIKARKYNDQKKAARHARGLNRPGRKVGELTHCKRGHEFTPENTYVTRKGHRQCRACARLLGCSPHGRTA